MTCLLDGLDGLDSRSTIFPVLLLLAFAFSFSLPVPAQDDEDKDETPKSQAAFPWRNIGPANMMGRIAAIDGLDSDYRTVLIGTASGGVWKSTSGGIAWDSIFDSYGSQSIGDVAFFQGDPDTIWVGTGEATNRNSVGWGDGIYKSTDGGDTFTHMGLKETRQISEIAPHPTDPNIVYVAAVGSLFGPSGERGLYKTTDGGETWTLLSNGLPQNGQVGATVVVLHPENPDLVTVGLYERHRSAFNMNSGGPNGGIFRSSDGGASFRQITEGLPDGDTGQIDLDYYLSDPSIMMAYVEASDELPDDLSVPGPGVYRSEDGGESWTYQLRHNSRPYYHGRIRINPKNDKKIYVIARDFFHSTDGGETYERGRPWKGGGGDDHDFWVAPYDENIFYMATDQGAHLSVDGGETVLSFNNMAIGQFYAIGVDMREPFWVYGGLQDNGGWGIPSNSRDRAGILTDHAIEANGGDGFHMQIDPTDWRTLYTTAHVGFFGRMNMETRKHTFITPTPQTIVNFEDYYEPDFDESPTNYSINGEERWIWRDIENRTINGANLPPQFRFNWNSPLVMSPNNPDTIYVGGSFLFKSVDKGESWRIVSPDLTRNDPATRNTSNSGGLTKDATGAENHNTIYTIDESAIDPDIVWTGSDDGLVQLTRNAGSSWTNVTGNIDGLPDGAWISRVEASKHDAATAYVTADRHWWDDYKPYVFRTRDFGESWELIVNGIPESTPGNSVYTIVEDHKNPELLFIGTEFGVFHSRDAGDSWAPFMDRLPPVAVHDLVIHPRDNALVAGTHGRSIWIVDDLTPLQQRDASWTGERLHVFEPPLATQWLDLSASRQQPHLIFKGENPVQGAGISYYLARKPRRMVKVTIEDLATGQVAGWEEEAREGMNRTYWDFEFPPSKVQQDTHRDGLNAMADVIRDAIEAASGQRDLDLLEHMQKDLLATQRYPQLYKDEQYPNLTDAKQLLLDHLRLVRAGIKDAETVRDFFDAREQLIAYSGIVGDQAYFGFYGSELRTSMAAPGRYRVTVKAGSREQSQILRVRADPTASPHREAP
ncbi:MAG: WD40/YVTN/BNR-like repeat-containing protein [Congregibacter sp.]